jgi:hypothetical protein
MTWACFTSYEQHLPENAQLLFNKAPIPMRVVINLAALQLGWFACVLGGAKGIPWAGIAVVALIAAYHLMSADRPGRESALLLVAGAIGAVWDGLLTGFGWLVYPSGVFFQWLAPSWIIAMWVAFATTFNVSLSWLKGRWYLASALGAIGGPLAYFAGAQLGGVNFPDPLVALAVIAGGWSFLMPMLLAIAQRLDGFASAPVRSTHDGSMSEVGDRV